MCTFTYFHSFKTFDAIFSFKGFDVKFLGLVTGL